MKQIQTKSLHAGSPRPRIRGAVVTPVFQSSTFEYHGEDYHDVGYLRLSNSPNHEVLAARIASLEQTEAALVTGSGMAAISATLFSVLSGGDHLLVQDCLYGGTSGLLNDECRRFGVDYTVIDPQSPETWAAHVKDNTRAVYVETLSNPLVQLADLESVAAFARERGLVSIIDNTFASPVNCRPATLGFDLVLESCTKYMSGHNDLIAGSVAGSAERVRKARITLSHLGGSLDPHGCYLLERGLKTLELRVRHQCASAGRIAEALEAHPAVKTVHYPGLHGHPQHERAARLLDGFGGMLSFELEGGVESAERFLAALRLPAVAASLGGAESLIVRPAAAVHSGLTPEERARSGIGDGLIRFSVGLEGSDDLLDDLTVALSAVESDG
jgi:cystathionine beta-lyase/cystathionine gamma-synthase